jgi:hypothetical protein
MSADAAKLLLAEKLITLYEAARRLPPGRNGGPVSLPCLLRWVTRGARGPAHERIRLEAIRVGGRWLTTEEALVRFAERLTPRLDGTPVPAPRTPTRRQRASQRAVDRLEQAGI